jgi:hypothetical protein
VRSIATASAARPAVPAATATAGHRDNLARFVSRLRNGCAIGSAGKRVRCAQRTHSHGDNGSSK